MQGGFGSPMFCYPRIAGGDRPEELKVAALRMMGISQ
jgi:hypothetical protein